MALRWYINPTWPTGVWPTVGLRNAMGLKKVSCIDNQIKHSIHIMYVGPTSYFNNILVYLINII